MFCFILLQHLFYCRYNRAIKVTMQQNIFAHVAIALQDLARLLQHLFYFIAHGHLDYGSRNGK